MTPATPTTSWGGWRRCSFPSATALRHRVPSGRCTLTTRSETSTRCRCPTASSATTTLTRRSGDKKAATLLFAHGGRRALETVSSALGGMALLPRQLPQSFIWRNAAAFAPEHELGDIKSAAADLAAMNPPLAFLEPLGQLALRYAGPLPQLPKKRRDLAVNERLFGSSAQPRLSGRQKLEASKLRGTMVCGSSVSRRMEHAAGSLVSSCRPMRRGLTSTSGRPLVRSVFCSKRTALMMLLTRPGRRVAGWQRTFMRRVATGGVLITVANLRGRLERFAIECTMPADGGLAWKPCRWT